jgi:Arc/MetJ-type ribon-helix-helix transcriptional regulator
MPMKVTTVRFSETLYAAIEEQARAEGVSASQFIREAAILRLGQLMAAQDSTATAEPQPTEAD